MEVKEIVDNWLKGSSVLHFWEMDGTYLVVARSTQLRSNLIYFLRVFKLGETWSLSQDAFLPFSF